MRQSKPEITESEVLKVKKFVRRIAMAVAKDPETTKVLFLSTRLVPFLEKLRTRGESDRIRLVAREIDKISKKEKILLKPESRKIIVRSALKFLNYLRKKPRRNSRGRR